MTYEDKNSIENEKKGTLGGHQTQVSPFRIPFSEHREVRDKRDKTTRAAKSSVDYWKERVRPRTLKDGTQTPEFYLRLKEGGRDAWFCLNTANRAEAARAARDLWQEVAVKGLEAVQAERRPEQRPERVCTVGEYLAAARPFAAVRPRVFKQYAGALRRVFCLVLELKAPSSRFYAKGKAAAEWRAKLDNIRLDAITPQDVERWRVAYINAEPDHAKRKCRAVSVASYIRNAKSAFTEHILAHVAPQAGKALVCLPKPLPFAGIAAPATTRRFRPTVKASDLYNAALRDFAGEPDALCAALLLITGGLRRGEADLFEWANVNLEEGKLTVTATKYFTPKTAEADRVVKLPPAVATLLRTRREACPKAVFVLEGGEPKLDSETYVYRANAWRVLMPWLRAQGVTEDFPLHALRKHAGNLVFIAGDAEAARGFLGHKRAETTAASYLDTKEVVADPTAK